MEALGVGQSVRAGCAGIPDLNRSRIEHQNLFINMRLSMSSEDGYSVTHFACE